MKWKNQLKTERQKCADELEECKIAYQGSCSEDEIPYIKGQDEYADGWNDSLDNLIEKWRGK